MEQLDVVSNAGIAGAPESSVAIVRKSGSDGMFQQKRTWGLFRVIAPIL